MKKLRKFQLELHWLIPLFLAIAAVVLLILSLQNRQRESRISHSLEQMDALSRIHVRLNTNILESRLFYLNHFDGIAQDQKALLDTSGLLVQLVEKARLASASDLHALFTLKNERIEAFKTSISIYKNSEQYIGVIISELMRNQGRLDRTFLLEFALFHNHMRAFLSRPDADRQQFLDARLRVVEDQGRGFTGQSRTRLDQIMAHARLLIGQATQIDRQVVHIIDREQELRLAALHQNLLRDQVGVKSLLKKYEQALYAIIVVLTLYTFFILIKLKLSNDLLELRVKERTRDLRKASQRAVNADAAKSAFLAHMSHEIRTPLNGVIGITSSLLKRQLDPPTREMVQSISHCGKSLLNLINDILDFSKIEANKLKLDIGPLSLHEVIDEAMAIVSENARQQNVALIKTISSSAPALLEGDRNRIGQILLNLLSNAIKFSKNGRVAIQVESLSLAPLHHQLTLRVIDNGIGIAEHQLKNLFQDFSQADPSIASKFGGTGLGLVISKKLAELMGGRITVESQYGAGSTFSFDFTARELEVPGDLAGEQQSQRPLGETHPQRILIVDDNFINRKVARDLLLELGYQPDVAQDGEQALQLMERQSYDIVFTDLRMPAMDGYELVRRARHMRDHSLRFVAMTASATLEEKEKCLNQGIQHFICKPIKEQDLVQVLRDHASS